MATRASGARYAGGLIVSGTFRTDVPHGPTQGRFDLIVSPQLLGELRDVLARPKLRRWVSDPAAAEYVEGLTDAALLIDDPPAQPGLSPDPDDDYLITLARAAGADYLVSGDHHLTGLADPTPPVLTPREFRDRLTEASSG